MKKLIFSIAVVFFSLTLSAQKIYFIYLQSEQEQAFYVRLNGKVQSSSASGYLILSKLQDSTYNFTVGFPQNKWKEQNFSIRIDHRDHGYLLKNFGEKGWGLFNLQTMGITMPVASVDPGQSTLAAAPQEVSAFTELLVRATGDPSLRERPSAQPQPAESKTAVTAIRETIIPAETVAAVVAPSETKPTEEKVAKPVEEKPAEKKAETVAEEVKPIQEAVQANPVQVADTAIQVKEELVVKPVETKTIVGEEIKPVVEEYEASVVTRRSESSTTEGFGLVFIDKYANGENDTIRLLIPNPKPAVTPVQEPVKEERKMLDIPVVATREPEKKTEEATPAAETVITEPRQPVPAKCAEVATEADFFKLRKLMVATESDADMISEAGKYFRTKCFTTQQVKNLGTLFLTDEGRYRFFDGAYSFAADPENFGTLQAELKDEYYVNRFKAMLRN